MNGMRSALIFVGTFLLTFFLAYSVVRMASETSKACPCKECTCPEGCPQKCPAACPKDCECEQEKK